MRTPTVAPLHAHGGYSVTAAVEAALVPSIIPQIKAIGGTDIIVSTVRMLVP